MKKEYTLYLGDGKLTKTTDLNQCYALKIDSKEGFEDLKFDLEWEGYPVPVLDNSNFFPQYFVLSAGCCEWLNIDTDILDEYETIIKLIKKG